MKTVVLFPALLLWMEVSGIEEKKYECKNDARFLRLNICIVEKVNLESIPDLAEASYPNKQILEFRSGWFDTVGVEFFQSLGEQTKQVTFRDGFVRELLFWSDVLENLQVINTDLTLLDVLGEPNYSLKTLAVRSLVFSRWSGSMTWLRALEMIDIGYCNFTFFNLDWLGSHKQLRVLDLSHNKLRTLASGPFLKLDTLEELYLRGNQLQYLWRFPDVVPNLQLITLSDNPWLCDWVASARGAIWVKNIKSMDSDFRCKNGWNKNGGLCCSGGFPNEAKIGPEIATVQTAVLDFILDESENESEIVGAHSNTAVVYLDKPISAS